MAAVAAFFPSAPVATAGKGRSLLRCQLARGETRLGRRSPLAPHADGLSKRCLACPPAWARPAWARRGMEVRLLLGTAAGHGGGASNAIRHAILAPTCHASIVRNESELCRGAAQDVQAIFRVRTKREAAAGPSKPCFLGSELIRPGSRAACCTVADSSISAGSVARVAVRCGCAACWGCASSLAWICCSAAASCPIPCCNCSTLGTEESL